MKTRNMRINITGIRRNRINRINRSSSIGITTITIYESIRVLVLTFIGFPWISFCNPGIINNAVILFSSLSISCKRSIHTKHASEHSKSMDGKNKSEQRIKARNKI